MPSWTGMVTTPLFRQILVALGPIVMNAGTGMTNGYSAILLPQLQSQNSTIKIDRQLSSWMASMSALPMAGGCILGGYLMEKLGRRTILIWACIPLSLGWFLIAASSNATLLLAGRFLTGLSDGLFGPSTGVFIAETSNPNVRGVLLMCSMAAITFGLFLVHVIGSFWSWRYTAWIAGTIPIPFAVIMFLVPESPTFLAKKGKLREARHAFCWFRGNSDEYQRELQELTQRQEELNKLTGISILQQMRGLSKPEFWKPTVIMILFNFTSQFSGHNVITAYCIEILKKCGISNETFNEYLLTIAIDLLRLITTIISCFLTNNMTRRNLTMLSGYGASLFVILFCSYLYVSHRTPFSSSLIPVVTLAVYACFLTLGLLPLSWTMIGEVFPLAYRGLGAAITSSACYAFLFLVIQTFPNLVEFAGLFGAFSTYGICTLAGTIFLTLFLPETKDKALYVIEDNFKLNKLS